MSNRCSFGRGRARPASAAEPSPKVRQPFTHTPQPMHSSVRTVYSWSGPFTWRRFRARRRAELVSPPVSSRLSVPRLEVARAQLAGCAHGNTCTHRTAEGWRTQVVAPQAALRALGDVDLPSAASRGWLCRARAHRPPASRPPTRAIRPAPRRPALEQVSARYAGGLLGGDRTAAFALPVDRSCGLGESSNPPNNDDPAHSVAREHACEDFDSDWLRRTAAQPPRCRGSPLAKRATPRRLAAASSVRRTAVVGRCHCWAFLTNIRTTPAAVVQRGTAPAESTATCRPAMSTRSCRRGHHSWSPGERVGPATTPSQSPRPGHRASREPALFWPRYEPPIAGSMGRLHNPRQPQNPSIWESFGPTCPLAGRRSSGLDSSSPDWPLATGHRGPRQRRSRGLG